MKFKAVLLLGITLVSGCGGGGGTSGGPVPRTVPLSTITRTLQIGDDANYRVTGTLKNLSTGQTVNISGTSNYHVTSLAVNGGTLPCYITTLELTDPQGNKTNLSNTFFYGQNPTTHQIDRLGERNSTTNILHVVNAPVQYIPGAWSDGVNINTPFSYTNGDSGNYTFIVENAVAIPTPSGNFQAWKVLGTESRSDGTSDSDTAYYCPALGTFVRDDGVANLGGYVLTYSVILTSTNIPL